MFISKYLNHYLTILKTTTIHEISMKRSTLSMHQFDKIGRLKIYQIGKGSCVLDVVWCYWSETVALEPSWWWMVKVVWIAMAWSELMPSLATLDCCAATDLGWCFLWSCQALQLWILTGFLEKWPKCNFWNNVFMLYCGCQAGLILMNGWRKKNQGQGSVHWGLLTEFWKMPMSEFFGEWVHNGLCLLVRLAAEFVSDRKWSLVCCWMLLLAWQGLFLGNSFDRKLLNANSKMNAVLGWVSHGFVLCS